jgi:HD-GYP domain-containing protein (c-di-GMP phosphodiesterase class II)
MTAARPYRPPLAPDEAAEELRRASGGQFDEQVVEALLRVV